MMYGNLVNSARNLVRDRKLEQYEKLEQEGLLVRLPPKNKYFHTDIDDAIRRASHMCDIANSGYNRLVLDALIEKQIRDEKAAQETAQKG